MLYLKKFISKVHQFCRICGSPRIGLISNVEYFLAIALHSLRCAYVHCCGVMVAMNEGFFVAYIHIRILLPSYRN